jgi:hypothetical protein
MKEIILQPDEVLAKVIGYFREYGHELNVESVKVGEYNGFGFYDEHNIMYYQLHGSYNTYFLNVFSSKEDINNNIEAVYTFYESRVVGCGLGEGDLPICMFYNYIRSIRLTEIVNAL